MGLIKAALSAAGGTLGDQWLDAIVPFKMTSETIMSKGIQGNQGDKRNQNKKGSTDVISDGSVIKVGEGQMMLLVDGGKIIDYSAEPGYYTVDNKNAPSLFSGDFKGALSDAFNRFKFGGTTPYSQAVYYINLAEIQNIPFGTVNAINYFDDFYNAELYIRAFGYYSVKIINPIHFYVEMASKSADYIDIEVFKKMCLAEFLTAFQTSVGQMSVGGERISHLSAKTTELAQHMETVLDESWEQRRGMKIVSVAISSISYDEKSKELIDIRNQGAMLGDPNIRTGYVQGAAARGIEAAGSNTGGATNAFMGVNMATGAAGGFIAAAGAVNAQQAEANKAAAQAPAAPVASGGQSDPWVCANCQNNNNGGKFCASCGTTRPAEKFCPECGKPSPVDAKFCNNCGHKF